MKTIKTDKPLAGLNKKRQRRKEGREREREKTQSNLRNDATITKKIIGTVFGNKRKKIDF